MGGRSPRGRVNDPHPGGAWPPVAARGARPPGAKGARGVGGEIQRLGGWSIADDRSSPGVIRYNVIRYSLCIQTRSYNQQKSILKSQVGEKMLKCLYPTRAS